MPAHGWFFKRAVFGRWRGEIGCSVSYNPDRRGRSKVQEQVKTSILLLLSAPAPIVNQERVLTDLSLLTPYRPNFCAECGAKIVRLRWRVWTSRRFCDNCSSRFARVHWLQRGLATILLFGVGLLMGRACRREQPPLVIQRTATSPATSPSASQSPVIVEQTYICGARTKKGTPCSRRVHGPVRCWQHKGAPAMLPTEKLIVKE